MTKDKKAYFNTIAPSRIKQRKLKAYYWNDITTYCDYFIHEDISVLEIGCGTGELLNEIKAKNKVGIDFSELMIEQAKKQFPNLDLRSLIDRLLWGVGICAAVGASGVGAPQHPPSSSTAQQAPPAAPVGGAPVPAQPQNNSAASQAGPPPP